MEDLPVPQNDCDGVQVPSINPKPMHTKSPPILHPYATCSKGRPPMHFLSTTTGMGSSGPETSRTSKSHLSFCVYWQFFLDLEQCQKVLVQERFIFYVLWATSETGNIIPFLSFFFPKSIPTESGPRLYGARQVGSGLYHTKVINDLVWPVTVTQETTSRCLSPSWEANLQ